MDLVALELLPGRRAFQQQAILDAAVAEGIGRSAVEEHDRPGRRLGAQGGAGAEDLLQRAQRAAVAVLDGQDRWPVAGSRGGSWP